MDICWFVVLFHVLAITYQVSLSPLPPPPPSPHYFSIWSPDPLSFSCSFSLLPPSHPLPTSHSCCHSLSPPSPFSFSLHSLHFQVHFMLCRNRSLGESVCPMFYLSRSPTTAWIYDFKSFNRFHLFSFLTKIGILEIHHCVLFSTPIPRLWVTGCSSCMECVLYSQPGLY